MERDGPLAELYRPELAADWDQLVAVAPGGTVMQTRRFLDYHGPRFRDVSLIGRRSGEAPLSMVFPLAADPVAGDLVVSHPGTSFGGVIARSRDPSHARAFLRAAAGWLHAQGFRRLLYRAPPQAVLRQPDDGLLPDLLRLGQVVQLDLWSVLRLTGLSRERAYWQSEIRRAERKGLSASSVETASHWARLHAVLSGRLGVKYGKAPVHSVDELVDLHARLGRQSRAWIIRDAAGADLAAQWFIDYGTGTLHNQYNGATDAGLAAGASSYGMALALEAAATDGFHAFSFGRSTNADGWTENRALLRFKAGFGAGLSSQFHIELPLDRLATLRQ
jgi:hypothetical protein